MLNRYPAGLAYPPAKPAPNRAVPSRNCAAILANRCLRQRFAYSNAFMYHFILRLSLFEESMVLKTQPKRA